MTTTPWASVRPGDVLLGGDGHEWTVTAKAPGTVALAREGAKPFTKRLTPGDERAGVVLVTSANDVLYDAIRDVQDVLGGTVISTQADGDQPMCPVDYATPGTMLAHLYTLHGVKFDGTAPDATLSDLKALHTRAHNERGSGYVPHQHTPKWKDVAK